MLLSEILKQNYFRDLYSYKIYRDLFDDEQNGYINKYVIFKLLLFKLLYRAHLK